MVEFDKNESIKEEETELLEELRGANNKVIEIKEKLRGVRLRINKARRTPNEELMEKYGEDKLFLKLKEWRLEKACELCYSPFIISTNRVLFQIVDKKPQTREELIAIEGIGQEKADDYGDDILSIVREYS